MIQVNVTALTHLTGLFLPGMLERRAGRILNVASSAAFQPGPLMAVYNATKAYVLSFSEALASETAGSGVTVTALCPGPVPTEFQSRAGTEKTVLFTGPLLLPVRDVVYGRLSRRASRRRNRDPRPRQQGPRPGSARLAPAPRDRDLAEDPGEAALTGW